MIDDEQAKKDWMVALGMEDDDNDSEFEIGKEFKVDEEATNNDDEEALSFDEGKRSAIAEELELKAVLGDCKEKVAILFSSTQLESLK